MRLLKATQGICGNRNLTYLDEFQPESLSLRILEFLDRFADTGGRYSNINQLTGQKHQAHEDPIACWGEIVNRIMEEQATPGERRKVVHTGLRASAALGSIAYCQIRDMDQRSLDITSGFTRNHELDVAAKHAIYALVVLIAALRKVIDSLCDSAREASPNSNSGVADIPDMKEFFQFAWTDKQYVMRKRRWP
ncbi:hypothetical protein [Chlorobium sp. N1]|uniref:hypothetical protein n=1 Tax=Chlorobium sp. N1 TaxID=2491138 RepID=UPI00103C0D35|nr:hypothetical protein [Chlorobium sp. N1]TCD46880.1 hypothetical protein E0L29_10895 [Chlorobium sp. N1]